MFQSPPQSLDLTEGRTGSIDVMHLVVGGAECRRRPADLDAVELYLEEAVAPRSCGFGSPDRRGRVRRGSLFLRGGLALCRLARGLCLFLFFGLSKWHQVRKPTYVAGTACISRQHRAPGQPGSSILSSLQRMEIFPGELPGVLRIEPTVHGDARGFFLESFRLDRLEDAGVDVKWLQDNHSRSRAGVVRGMHFQPGQWKLVRAVRGAILDVACDIRVGSPTFGQWEAHRLDDEQHHQLLIPDGFAHGFVVLSDVADVAYKTSAYYDPAAEGGFKYDDPAVGIEWPNQVDLISSARDESAPLLDELIPQLPFSYQP